MEKDELIYQFHDTGLLTTAMTHSSYANEHRDQHIQNNERLEFLGDSILGLVSADYVFHRYPHVPEGQLTKLRAAVVCEQTLYEVAKELGLDHLLRLGRGEENGGGRKRPSILADSVEALIGAIYLDGGMQPAKAFIDRFILSDLEDKRLFYDSKSNLQELIQGKLKKEFEYRLLEESGPEHDKTFVVEIDMEGECLGRGQGRTKKAAEQQAAYEALLLLRDRGYVFKKY